MADTQTPASAKEPTVYVNDEGNASVIAPSGEAQWVPASELSQYLDAGYHPESQKDHETRKTLETHAVMHDSPMMALLAGFGRGATLGATDWINKQTGDPDLLQVSREKNPGLSSVGEGMGMLSPVSAVGSVGRGATMLGKGILSRALASGAAEGAAIAAGHSLSPEAIDKALADNNRVDFADVVDFAKNVGKGAILGGGATLVGSGLFTLGRFVKDRAAGLTKTGRAVNEALKDSTKRLDSHLDIINERDNLLEQLATTQPNTVTATVRQNRLSKLNDRISASSELGSTAEDVSAIRDQLSSDAMAAKTDAIADSVAGMASKSAAFGVAGALAGGIVSAVPGGVGYALGGGAAMGWLNNQLKQKLIDTIAPIATKASRAIFTSAPKIAQRAGTTATTLSINEFTKLRTELMNSPDPQQVYQATMDKTKGSIPPEIAHRVATQAANGLSTITNQILGPEMSSQNDIPENVGAFRPSRKQLIQATQVIDTVVNPQHAVQAFIRGNMTQEQSATLHAVYPDESQALLEAVMQKVEAARTRGESFDRHLAAQIKVFQSGATMGTQRAPSFAQSLQQQSSPKAPRINSAPLSRHGSSSVLQSPLAAASRRLGGQ